MILNINAVKPLISLTTSVLQMDIGKVSSKQLETIVGAFTKPGTYEVKRVTKKRSLSANALAWVLCDQIADKLNATKEEVYRKAVADVGVFTELSFKSPDAMKSFKAKWQANGIGWLTRTVDEKTLHAYYGSSVYDRAEMSRLLDWLVDAAQSVGVPTMSDEELKVIIGKWGE
jgi:hypothetical protein